ncbi:MAG: sigma-70 family RNA polymerase sigma factor [Chloroflexi bacterium]|nr:sigma-70 family RNA polymerase sigma factor [Chloroflexota bacterium]
MSKVEIPSPSDAELIARAQSGDDEAFGDLYVRYLDPIYRYLRIKVDEAADAEDLCEAVFLRTFEALDRYQERGHPFSAYLYQVARSQLADFYRTHVVGVDLEQVPEPAAEDADPEATYAQRERALDAVHSLGKLRDDYQEVIRLRVILELPTSTVAMWMDRSPGAVRVLLHRALIALREELDG